VIIISQGWSVHQFAYRLIIVKFFIDFFLVETPVYKQYAAQPIYLPKEPRASRKKAQPPSFFVHSLSTYSSLPKWHFSLRSCCISCCGIVCVLWLWHYDIINVCVNVPAPCSELFSCEMKFWFWSWMVILQGDLVQMNGLVLGMNEGRCSAKL